MKIFITGLLALFTAVNLYSADKLFRSGRILAAELTFRSQTIKQFNPEEHPELPQKRIYAQVVLEPFPGREVSSLDYSLRAFGKDYRCIAIKEMNGSWIGGIESDIKYPDSQKRYAMLFILDGNISGINPVENYTLKCNYPPQKHAETPLTFNNLKQGNFSLPAAIPAAGKLTVEK